MKNTPKKSEPMDATVHEVAVGTPRPNQQRVCYAAQTLVAEVESLFPETPVEYSNYDGRNTALDVTFDLTTLDAGDRYDLTDAFRLLDGPAYNEDRRIAKVLDEDGAVLVSFRSNPRTQDSREPFGIIDAMSVLSGREEFHYGDDEDSIWGGSL